MEIKQFSKEQIIEINREAVKISGDPFGILNEGNLEYAVTAHAHKFNNKPLDEAIIWKASTLLDLIAGKGHIFIEGNKRTGYSAAAVFLDQNSLGMSYSNYGEVVDFIILIAQGKANINKIAKWVGESIIKKEGE